MKHSIIFFIYYSVINSYLFLLSFIKKKESRIVLHQPFKYGYDCNPRYIADELLRRDKNYELIWITRENMITNQDFPERIKVVTDKNIFKLLYYISTAKICISNSYFGLEKYNYKKKNQIFIDTWHGSLGIKRIGATEKDRLYNQKKLKDVDIFISNSDFETDVYRKSLVFDKKIYKLGHPRNDIFFENSPHCLNKEHIKEKISEYIRTNINDKKIVLYAPTFRENPRTDCFDMNYELLLDSLNEKYNAQFILALRFHPRTDIVCRKKVKNTERIFDFTHFDDMQGLMAVSDILITDYSSCIFDFMLSRKPAFIYASDIKKYNNERGFYYPLESTPFPIIKNNEELKKTILDFDDKIYLEKTQKFLEEKGCIDDGHAAERTVDLIEKLAAGREIYEV